MRIKSVSYSRGATLKTIDYEFVRIDVGAEADVDPKESFQVAFDEVKAQVDDALREEVKAVRARVQRRLAREAIDDGEDGVTNGSTG